ncbi:hypothetical protein FPCIR_12029 [Fusarium pseudocircinatum]|uniref:Uncharacterized protein n=1 Tax=Fusarium pseudocircinatum TaxID=56676 RepID=A0A8H5NVS7_9HYPO|nr:hypothetical protein FPCIR_12029 [Fusarium pseudocircinatum]
MNPGSSEPRPVAGESPLQSSRRANKRRRHDQNGGGDERDGPKWPQGKLAIVSFECPFCKLDPHRYAECKGYQLTRLSDVMQHLSRQHRILEVTLGSGEIVGEHDIVLYCTRCRYLFHGMGASRKRDIHMNRQIQCQPANIEQTGVMLDGEFEGLRSKLRSYPRHSETFRWNIIWTWCFPGKSCPPSPYVEIIVPRAEVQSIIQDELGSIPGLSQERAQLIARRSADRIYNTSSPTLEAQSNRSIPSQARINTVQAVPDTTYDTSTNISPNQALTSQPFHPQINGIGYSSGLPNAGVYATPNTFTNNSAPSPAPDFGAHADSGNNFLHPGYFTGDDSGYPPVSYVGYPTGAFESANQEDDYLNIHGNATGRHRSHY